MTTVAITIRFMVQIEIGGMWTDRAQKDLFSEADDLAKDLQKMTTQNVRVVQRETRDTVCIGWRGGDKAMRKGR